MSLLFASQDPVNQQCNRVFRLGDTRVGRGSRDPCRSRGGHAGWVPFVSNDPAVNINMVRIEVIRNVAILSSPRLAKHGVSSGLNRRNNQTLNVSNCVFGCDIQELKKLKSPSKRAFPFASAYAGSNPISRSGIRSRKKI